RLEGVDLDEPAGQPRRPHTDEPAGLHRDAVRLAVLHGLVHIRYAIEHALVHILVLVRRPPQPIGVVPLDVDFFAHTTARKERCLDTSRVSSMALYMGLIRFIHHSGGLTVTCVLVPSGRRERDGAHAMLNTTPCRA